MADSRTKNATRNMMSGIINRLATIVLMFISRTVILYLLGANYLGIGTLFTSVLSFLSLAELGMASAIVFTMYKPVAENDYETINAILAYYKRLYSIIGLIILGIGTLIVPFIPKLISGDPPAGVNVYILYYLYLINSVISYFFAGYKQSVLSAYQRIDITKKIATLTSVLLQVLQILALVITKNFYVYATVPIFCTLLNNAINAYVVYKKFPQIKPVGKVSDELRASVRSRLSGLFGTKLNSVVVHQADTVVISAFLGLTMTGIYGNYYYIFNAVSGIIIILYQALTAGIGNKLIKDSIEESYNLFKHLEYGNALIVSFCCANFFCLYEPFMKIWVGDDLRLGQGFTCLMVTYFFIYQIGRTILTFKDAAGIWREDRMRPYASMIINLVSNLIMVQFIGIYGIVASTILAFVISMPWANKVLFDSLFKVKSITNIVVIGKYAVITAASCGVCYLITNYLPGGIIGLVLKLVVCSILSIAIFVILTCKTEEFKYWKMFVLSKIRKVRA